MSRRKDCLCFHTMDGCFKIRESRSLYLEVRYRANFNNLLMLFILSVWQFIICGFSQKAYIWFAFFAEIVNSRFPPIRETPFICKIYRNIYQTYRWGTRNFFKVKKGGARILLYRIFSSVLLFIITLKSMSKIFLIELVFS